jgi:hypothetical protein
METLSFRKIIKGVILPSSPLNFESRFYHITIYSEVLSYWEKFKDPYVQKIFHFIYVSFTVFHSFQGIP